MLSPEGCAGRHRKLWDALGPERADTDVLLLADPQNLIYFAGYAPSPFVFRANDASAILVLEPDRATLVADSMVRPYLDKAHVDEIVAPVWYDGKRTAPSRRGLLVETARGFLQTLGPKRVGVELGSVPAGVVEQLRGERAGALGHRSRPDRPPASPDQVRRRAGHPGAVDARGEAGHAAALEQVEPGMTEQDVYRLVQNAALAAIGTQALVYGDFASGPRCETERGGPPTDRRIARGDLFLLDYSVVVDGYRGDFTNTFAVGAPPSDQQRALFDACMKALAAGEAELRPGNAARNVDRAIRATLAPLNLERFYLSHSGHGLGLSHPEPPYFVAESDETIIQGDVVAIEPGLYVPGVGGMRFERNYVITADGYETLSHHRLTLER